MKKHEHIKTAIDRLPVIPRKEQEEEKTALEELPVIPRKESDMDEDANISPEELALLDASGEDAEEQALHDAELDDVDADGELLNEKSSANSKSGRDLDVPGADADNDMEDIGEEDEENNLYSRKDND